MAQINLSAGKFSNATAVMVNGIAVDIGATVFRWNHKQGFNGYTTKQVTVEDRNNGKDKIIKGPRYSKRKGGVDAIKQFFIHHSGGDGANPSGMYETLYNNRRLSVQFAAEDDGRIYQFNDVIDCCWHAGSFNGVSFGCEACLFPLVDSNPDFYSAANRKRSGNLPHKTMVDTIHGRKIKVFCFTEPQLDSLARLGAGVWIALGMMRTGKQKQFDEFFKSPPKFPRNTSGAIPRTVVNKAIEHVGMIGHLQTTRNKIDPAGFPWEIFEQLVEKYFNEFKERIEF